MGATPDIARIISVIMENPRLIEEISKMASGERTEVAADTPPPPPSEVEIKAQPTVAEEHAPRRKNRGDLLCALKPYVSKERAQAIDSMLSVVEILDVMKGGK
jgi:hypothetical protein